MSTVCAIATPVAVGGISPLVCEAEIRGIPPDGGVPYLLHGDGYGFPPLHVYNLLPE